MAETFAEFKKKQERQRKEAEKNTYGLGKLGESLMDRTLGVLKGTGQEALGLGSKALGSLSGFLGGPLADDATNFSLLGDELRQRGYENFYKGYKKGPESILKSGEYDPITMNEKNEYLTYLKDAETKKRLDEENYDPSAAVNEFGTNYGGLSQRVPGVDDEFDNIFLKIKEREIASKAKQKVLDEEKSNLDTFPKLSIGNSATVEKMELEQKEMDAKAEAEAGYEDGGEDAYEKLQNSALEDIAKSKGEEVTPETKEELLAKYKKEFYEATGLDPSGKADKSSALMAMGLALMQNKAGKGFNVGKMLSAVGEAGEKALPELTKAKAAAKAETVAAGKYALDRIKAGESASAALAKEARLYKKELYLKKLEFENEAAKAKAKGIEYKNVSSNDVVKDVPLSYGVVDGRSILAKPLAESRGIVGAYNRYSHAQTILNEMESNLQNLANADSPTLRKIVDRVKGVAVGLGITSASQAFGEELISDETSTDNKRRLLINEYKRLLLQESQVSDLDLITLQESFGKSGLFGNVEQQIDSLKNMKSYFGVQQDKTYEALLQMKLPELYTNQNEYNNTQKYISDNLDKTYTIIPLSQQSNTKSIATLDISKGG